MKENYFFALFCDEVTLIDNQYWLSIHAYTIQNRKMIPMLLSMEHVVDGFNVANLITMIIHASNFRH